MILLRNLSLFCLGTLHDIVKESDIPRYPCVLNSIDNPAYLIFWYIRLAEELAGELAWAEAS